MLTKNNINGSNYSVDDVYNVKDENAVNHNCISTQPSLNDLKSHLNIIHNNM